jgi:lipopolysaccharide export system protein LptC
MPETDMKDDEGETDLRTRPGSFRARATGSPRATLMSARRYSIFVKVMKGALPGAALALGIAVFVYALQPRDPAHVAFTFEKVGEVKGDLAMARPRLIGTDDQGLPFVVTAASASQASPGSDSVRLTDVVADFTMKDGSLVHLVASKGVVDTKARLFDLSGGIHLTSNDGYDMRTEAASADLNAGTVRGATRIEADGKFGHIGADRFTFNRTTRKVQFNGHVQMLLRRATR